MTRIDPALASLALAPVEALRSAHSLRNHVSGCATALATFGQRLPVVAVRGTGQVLWGHEWVDAARELGWAHVAVLMVDDDEQTATAFMLAAYRATERGYWNDQPLLEALDKLEATPHLHTASGFSADAHADLRRKLVPRGLGDLVDEFAPPELDLGFTAPVDLPVRSAQHALTVRPHPHPGDATFKTLLSYHYFQTVDIDDLVTRLGGDVQLFVDSGAFSAKTQGVEIDMAAYAHWLRRWQHRFEAFASLDVIGDAAASAANQAALEAMGVDALPVFHGGEDFYYLEAYCEQYPYVCIGGQVGWGGQSLLTGLAKSFEIAARHGAVLHGFGQTNAKILAEFPWYSVDSTSWGKGHRFGTVDLWDNQAGEFTTVNVGDHAGVYAKAELIREHGVDPEALADRGQYHHHQAIACSAQAWRNYARFLQRRHGAVKFPDGSRSPGLHLYLVDGSTDNLVAAAAQHHTSAVIEDLAAAAPAPVADTGQGSLFPSDPFGA